MFCGRHFLPVGADPRCIHTSLDGALLCVWPRHDQVNEVQIGGTTVLRNLVLENTEQTVTCCCQPHPVQEKKSMGIDNFHTHTNTNPEAILIRISTRKPSNIFCQKKQTKKTYRRLATQEHKSLPEHETMLELAFARLFTVSTTFVSRRRLAAKYRGEHVHHAAAASQK
jgi:hypothetical protein